MLCHLNIFKHNFKKVVLNICDKTKQQDINKVVAKIRLSLVILILGEFAPTMILIISSSTFQELRGKRANIAHEAKSNEGSELWSYASPHKTGADTWKCNTFVAEMIEAAEAEVPHSYNNKLGQWQGNFRKTL